MLEMWITSSFCFLKKHPVTIIRACKVKFDYQVFVTYFNAGFFNVHHCMLSQVNVGSTCGNNLCGSASEQQFRHSYEEADADVAVVLVVALPVAVAATEQWSKAPCTAA